MAEENLNVETNGEKCNCICHSKGFRKFLVTALGTFVGVYCALCLFTAIHKPPMPMPMYHPCPCMMSHPCPCAMGHKHHPDFTKWERFKKDSVRPEHVRAPFERGKAPVPANR